MGGFKLKIFQASEHIRWQEDPSYVKLHSCLLIKSDFRILELLGYQHYQWLRNMEPWTDGEYKCWNYGLNNGKYSMKGPAFFDKQVSIVCFSFMECWDSQKLLGFQQYYSMWSNKDLYIKFCNILYILNFIQKKMLSQHHHLFVLHNE